MPALETFDWLVNQYQASAQADIKKYLEEQRQYLLAIRNENERRRFVEEVMLEVRSMMRDKKN